MDSKIKTKTLHIGGMTCVNCQNKINHKLSHTAGVVKADVSYRAETATVTFDEDIISLKAIVAIIQKLDYEVKSERTQSIPMRPIGILVIVIAVYLLMQYFGFTNIFNAFPTAEAGMGYGMLFLIGLLTSVHCLAMCGGINLSQCIPQADKHASNRKNMLAPSLIYNLGRVISYTVIGGIVGALGSVVSLSGAFRGIVQLVAGVFMVVMGVNMLGLFPWLRKFNPRMPKIFARKIGEEKGRSKSPLYVGLLNGLMPCGPLQAMQLYALSTGGPVQGALAMLVFSLGTVPLMFGLGALSSVLSKKFTKHVMTVGAALVFVLGLSMFTQGWALSGFTVPSVAATPQTAMDVPEVVSEETETETETEKGVQVVDSTLNSRAYPAITVQAGVPVKWTISAPNGSINGCNNVLYIPEYDIEHQFVNGDNVIEFTPTKAGTFGYSCWMGMIRSTITVT